MDSIVTVITPAPSSRLTTLERVKLELGITDTDNDTLLLAKIDEASSDVEAYLRYRLPLETVSETFRGLGGDYQTLSLNRTPVVAITTVTNDGVLVDDDDYLLDAGAGLLSCLSSGYPAHWMSCQTLTIVYQGGWILPEETGRTLPYAIEGAVLEMISGYWAARGRDPLLKRERVEKVGEFEYWVGSTGGGDSGLPPGVVTKLAPFRRPSV